MSRTADTAERMWMTSVIMKVFDSKGKVVSITNVATTSDVKVEISAELTIAALCGLIRLLRLG